MMKPISHFAAFAFLLLLPVIVQAQEKHALLIGVSEYKHAQMNRTKLEYPEADARAVGKALKTSDYKVVTLLGRQATAENITAALKKISGQGDSKGVVLIGLFGHGVQYGEDAYYGPYNTSVRFVEDSKGNKLRSDDGAPKLEPNPDSMVSMRAILDALTACGAGNRVLLADCCREDPSRARGRAFGSKLKVSDLPSGTAALFACSANEQAFEHKDWGHGAFTHSLLERLAAGRKDLTANTLSVDLYRDVDRKVRDKTSGKETQTVNPIINGIVDLGLAGDRSSVTNSIGMEFRLIPAGEFMMGSKESAEDIAKRFDSKASLYGDEHPQHRVRLTKEFYLGTYEVTVGQFRRFVDATGYQTEAETDGKGGRGFNLSTNKWENNPKQNWDSPGFEQSETHPVVNVSWNDAIAFCNWLSRVEGVEYRLPTEAQWEYACRGGTSTLFYHGDNSEGLAFVGNIADGTGKAKINFTNAIKTKDGSVFTSKVGKYRSNEFGLHDMHGNVWEWCSDWYGEDYYQKSPPTNPAGPTTGSSRVSRGGSWSNAPRYCRSANRNRNSPGGRSFNLGFRVLRSSIK